MKGHIHTDEFLHPILAHRMQGNRRISDVFLADMKTYHKLLYVTDGEGIWNIWPTPDWQVNGHEIGHTGIRVYF